MSWHLGRMAGFDLETTGVDVEQDRIVTACVVQCGGRHPTFSTSWMADPGIDIPEGASKVHGITTEQARAEGQPTGQVIEQLVRALYEVVYAGIPIVAMNAAFDLTMLDREARRHRVYPLAELIAHNDGQLRVIDPYVLDKQIDKFRRGSRKLVDLARHYRVPIGEAHTADADALAACRIVWRMGQSYPDLPRVPLDELHVLQTGWAREQAESLAAHWRRNGRADDADQIRTEWPLIPHQQDGDQ